MSTKYYSEWEHERTTQEKRTLIAWIYTLEFYCGILMLIVFVI
jgi:hypothetical protein